MATASELKLSCELEGAELSNNSKASNGSRDALLVQDSVCRDRKVELRMDEITSKFKNAFERMAELESLQLSMEEDSHENMKEKWFQESAKKTNFQDKEGVGRSLTSSNAAAGLLIRTKEERLSPMPDENQGIRTKSLEVESDFDVERHQTRHEVSDERGFPPEWSYEEQFKKLYDLGDEAERKEFLDKLFAFMQHRGTPVNRVPIMAKQTLDLFKLFKLVTDRGGLVEVINKKIWRGIIKGLNLPSSVTSAAFTLRTQYMKYLYPYECSTMKLSSPTELQCAIDGNRRDTSRRPSIGHYTSMVEPEVGFYSNSTSPKSNCSSPTLKRPSSPTISQSAMTMRLPGESEFVSPSFHGNNGIGFAPAIQRMITSTSDSRTPYKYDTRAHSPGYTNGRASYEPPYKRIASSEEIGKHIALAQGPWANIKIRTNGGRGIPVINENGEEKNQNNEQINNSAGKSPNRVPGTTFEHGNDNSIAVSIELNGIKYQGVLYAQHR
ncbi:AT-rich interactive domain-containing protein 3C-like isoform X2 [Dendronephthya gigantea]|uniref:AT-rich interactive domain-containing protein 3C-like isoform X2 n=1 Tax=Dendronephthya gigantea TaxID=151771 RepID=UPI001069C42E|nr:AT-rich interactive domain-containing protein 3C-like isoform X2 [Dendronephthya gigantea]